MSVEFAIYVAVGFLAQLVDGALGMAFGVISTSFLLTTGVSPAIASASVHAAEVVTTGISGLSHLYHRNVDRRMFVRLTVAGMAGGVIGAYLLTGLPEEIIAPVVAVYLCAMALLIVYRVVRKIQPKVMASGIFPLGLGGGFLDAMGGGGWGPLVVSTLIARGNSPRHTIGSVNLAEFFVTLSISITFMLTIAPSYFATAAGLIVGGALAAPLAGYMSKRLPARALMLLVSVVVMSLGVLSLIRLTA
ncbi:MAG TPA: sulfite exporter TauE/SafE family protein [Alphaproteobacteria bacterium]|nr:sulfite exporter TauE/SafE family protein [Alphaproteobacteria bacterium]